MFYAIIFSEKWYKIFKIKIFLLFSLQLCCVIIYTSNIAKYCGQSARFREEETRKQTGVDSSKIYRSETTVCRGRAEDDVRNSRKFAVPSFSVQRDVKAKREEGAQRVLPSFFFAFFLFLGSWHANYARGRDYLRANVRVYSRGKLRAPRRRKAERGIHTR